MSEPGVNNRTLREMMLLCFHEKNTIAETVRRIKAAYGDNSIARQTVTKWFLRFRSGDYSLEDRGRPGQLKKFEDDELLALIQQDPTQSQESLARALNVTQATISKRIVDLGLAYQTGKWMEYDMNLRHD